MFRLVTPTEMPQRQRIAVEGRNCWRRARADRVAFLVDGSAYFTALQAVLCEARHSILMLGWEIDSRVRLDPEAPADGPPTALGALLDDLVRARPGLEARILIWDTAFLFALNRELLTSVKLDWMTHPRLIFRQDANHPIGASHHQKMVVVDERLAFIGGVDLTQGRWDTPQHIPDDPRRVTAAGEPYPPFHDVEALIEGDAAAALGELARRRWLRATGETLPVSPAGGRALWPAGLPADVEDVMVAIARTQPAWDRDGPVREIEELWADTIAAAKHFVFIENQYFASRRIARCLAQRLREPQAPEVVAITAGAPLAVIERLSMMLSRSRLLARLRRADRRRRFGVFRPLVEGKEVKIHSKLAIIDDQMLRIGSANANNRSMGVDTECDVLIEAEGDERVAAGIRALRLRLLAEHLGCAPETVAAAEQAGGGMLGAISTLSSPRRGLDRLSPEISEAIAAVLPDSSVFDPDSPLEAAVAAEAGIAQATGDTLAFRARLLAGLVLALAVAAVTWPHLAPVEAAGAMAALDGLAVLPWAPAFAVGLFVLLQFTMVPVALPILACGALFGLWPGAAWAMAGILIGAALLHGLGRGLGRERVARLAGPRVARVGRRLVRHGLLAVALLHLVPVASFAVTNLVVGASRVRFVIFAAGTMLAMLPTVLTLALLGEWLADAARDPSPLDAITAIGLAAALAAAATSLARQVARASGGPR